MLIVHYRRSTANPDLIIGSVHLKGRGTSTVPYLELVEDVSPNTLIAKLEDEAPGQSITFTRIHPVIKDGKVQSSHLVAEL